jgi:aminomethyltransferase
MPLQYEGIREEHLAVRAAAGVFDVSHMGQIQTRGPEAGACLQRLLSNDVEKIAVGGAQYSVLCREDGGVLDDLFTYRLDGDRYLTVTNASNHERDLSWFEWRSQRHDVEIVDRNDELAMLAVQGPAARAALAPLIDGELPERQRCAETVLAGVPCLVCGTGYTGEDGVELLLGIDDAPLVWDVLLAQGVVPCGLGARDTLRVEACFHLYGSDLSQKRNPIEAGLAWCCKLETGFIGAAALDGLEPAHAFVPFVFTGPGIPRQGNPIHTDDGFGVVTSGTLSPCLGRGVGLGYVPIAASEPGTAITVDVRGTPRSAEVKAKPLVQKET